MANKLDGEIPRKDMTINENDTTPAANSRCPASAGSALERIHQRVKNEMMECKQKSPARETLRWVLGVIRDEQNDG